MKKNNYDYAKNILIPGIWLSILTGVITGAVIFAFKVASSRVLELSAQIYGAVRNEPIWLPVLLIGAAAVGGAITLILRKAPDSRGGGIPTAIASLRGYALFTNMMSVVYVFVSSMLTYFVGVPLGTEGPGVQMGTLIGWGVSRLFSRKSPAWERYVMTGGASAGFAAATGAPLTSILFAFEEAHTRFSPMIFMFSAIGTVTGTATMQLLCRAVNISPSLFDIRISIDMPIQYVWVAIAVGLACGFYALLFTKGYRYAMKTIDERLARIPLAVKVIFTCVSVAALGFFSNDFIGTGHSLVEGAVDGHMLWYWMLILICVRAIYLAVANVEGVTGGLFIPSLALGAMIGSLCGYLLCYLQILPEEYYSVAVVVGISSFLAASSRTPLMAIAFAIEALGGFSNVLYVAVGVTVAFVIVEASNMHGFTDTVVESKIMHYNYGRERKSYDVDLVVSDGAFVIGKEIRDVLWPPSCVIVSVSNNPDIRAERGRGLSKGDVLHVHYSTCYPEFTAQKLEDLVGKQEKSD